MQIAYLIRQLDAFRVVTLLVGSFDLNALPVLFLKRFIITHLFD